MFLYSSILSILGYRPVPAYPLYLCFRGPIAQGGERRTLAKVIERVEARYEFQTVKMGKVLQVVTREHPSRIRLR